jgi:hypothetical protein
MGDIISMVALGAIAGMISGFFTRIIKKGMIFACIGNWLRNMDNISIIKTTKHSLFVQLVRCIFCLGVWIALALDVFYIIEYSPYWVSAIIGVFSSLGAGNLIAEITCSLRNDE